jgi:glycosyltransferase involved in cell wall biosynthesis
MTRIGAHLIFGSNEEPFLQAALRSVEWVDYVCAVNTAPGDGVARANEEIVRSVIPAERLRLAYVDFAGRPFSFSEARNTALDLAEDGDYVLIVDSDDVHWPGFEAKAREYVAVGAADIITAHFEHLCLYKDLRHSLRHREILWRKTPDVRFESGVHEKLQHPREHPALVDDYRYHHLGYIKAPAQVHARWMLYQKLGGEMHEYDGTPDDALEDWPRVCEPYEGEHPPAVREVLEGYPPAPQGVVRTALANSEWKYDVALGPMVGLVLLTWDDAENLRSCLDSLANTTEPFELVVVDNGSTDESLALIEEFGAARGKKSTVYVPLGAAEHPSFRRSLAEALNIGFGHFMDRPDIDYVGWIHPDMTFEHPDWLYQLRHMLDVHPDVAKVGAEELDPSPGVRAGNSQCYLVRRWALERVGLFDERFQACGGGEDWWHNRQLLTVGKVMIWPAARIKHNAMSTRNRHDNVEAGRHNMELYYQLAGTWDPPV